jgi:uncharacterized protein YdcH (DUF465 family)
MDSKLDKMDGKLDRIAKAQENIADRIDIARKEIVSEVKGLRLDLKDCALTRLSKRKVDPVESPIDIRPRMRQKPG